MSELDWDDPNYVEQPSIPISSRDYKLMNEKYERSLRREYNRDYRGEDSGRNYRVGDSGRDYRGGNSGRDYRKGDSGGDSRNSDYGYNEIISIASSMVGRIIGPAGSNVARLQNDFNVCVNINKKNLVVKVSGQQKRDVTDAADRIRQQISSDFGGGDEGGRRDNRDFGHRSSYGGGKGGGGRGYSGSNYEAPQGGDLTGLIDWDAVNKASERAQAERWAKCLPITKNFYKEASEVANLPQSEVERMRKENNNTTVSYVFEQKEGEILEPIPNPIWKFEQCFAEYPDLLAEIQKQGFRKPSPIQAQAWPILLQGRDMIGIAQTGTGKTLAFLLPGMIHTEYQSIPRGQRGGANVLVLAPTRELALQIEMEVNKYSFRNMRAVCVYGGGSRKIQVSDVERGAEIIICTPGRLNDLIQSKVIDVGTITYLVLDEADRMLDMGFEPQIRKILLDIPPNRQTIMTSATWPPGVRRLANSYMTKPVTVCVGSLDLAATHSVRQVIKLMGDDKEKYRTLKSFATNMSAKDKIIIFCGRKARADDLSSDLTLDGFVTQCIHGNREQSDREQAIADIKSGAVHILVATDVASRGLDIEDISHVINYDFPRNIEEYVHRVGRTGRAGRQGTSISFITREDWAMAKELIDILEEAKQEVHPELIKMASRFKAMKEKRAEEGGGGGFARGGGFGFGRNGGSGFGRGGGRRSRY